ncbi:hypothetical protein BHE74_00043308 [Ensete ventricosum]|nr:hypothetical protein BHE74_00043308 [Ensete ventricosum]
MVLILETLLEILRRPTVADVAVELAAFVAPLWIAVLAGLLLGWAWRPRWAAGLSSGAVDTGSAPSPGPHSAAPSTKASVYGIRRRSEKLAMTEDDLEHLCRLVEVTDGGPEWHKMMDKSSPDMRYQAWRRDPETGPPQYRSSTIYEDAMPEIVRDFFWDDEFRIKNGWDDMLLEHTTLEECPTTGTMVVRWVRKFPFFCSNREYIIGRRIWERDGRMTACEVLLFHHEDMGIPWEIAKLGVRQGMWSCVRKIEPGLRAYQVARRSNEPLSRFAFMAQINTKFDADKLRSLETVTDLSGNVVESEKQKNWTSSIPKFLVVGGAVAVACTLDHGLLTKAVIFGVARRFANIGKRL